MQLLCFFCNPLVKNATPLFLSATPRKSNATPCKALTQAPQELTYKKCSEGKVFKPKKQKNPTKSL